jgi:hypothetical protein
VSTLDEIGARLFACALAANPKCRGGRRTPDAVPPTQIISGSKLLVCLVGYLVGRVFHGGFGLSHCLLCFAFDLLSRASCLRLLGASDPTNALFQFARPDLPSL